MVILSWTLVCHFTLRVLATLREIKNDTAKVFPLVSTMIAISVGDFNKMSFWQTQEMKFCAKSFSGNSHFAD